MRKSSSLTSRPRGSRCRGCPTRTGSTAFKISRNTAFTLHRPSDISSGANEASTNGFHEKRDTNHATWFFPAPPATPRRATPSPANGFSRITDHETRITKHGTRLFFAVGAQGTHNQTPPPGPPRTPPGRCFPARCGAAWGGYGAAWAAAVPRSGNTACWVFTSHETRNMVFPSPSGDSKKSNPNPGQRVFTNHGSRNTNHGFYASLPTISHDFPAFPAISRGVGGAPEQVFKSR